MNCIKHNDIKKIGCAVTGFQRGCLGNDCPVWRWYDCLIESYITNIQFKRTLKKRIIHGILKILNFQFVTMSPKNSDDLFWKVYQEEIDALIADTKRILGGQWVYKEDKTNTDYLTFTKQVTNRRGYCGLGGYPYNDSDKN